MLCKCGCGETTAIISKTNHAQGRIKGRPNDFVYGHHNRRPRPERRLGLGRWTELEWGYVTPCHIWTGPLSKSGCGQVRDPATGRTRDAYVMVWEARHGPVPEGLELDHLCRVRACVREDHLEPVTHAENMRRAYA
jgi:hypothetical protein